MTTQKPLYWDRPYDRVFASRVTSARVTSRGLEVELEDTLFYPEGGGQPADLGVIAFDSREFQDACGAGSLRVTGVSREKDNIVHIIELPAEDIARLADSLTGVSARGEIDWTRRFDLMQQHTGQHILSRAFEVVADAKTVGFHLGEEYVSIDLSVPALGDGEIAAAERLANDVVFSDQAVVAKQYEAGVVPAEVRTRFDIGSENIRVVYAGDFDACACGGTHVSSTGQIGLIKVNGTDRAHGGVRVVFRCGARALRDYGQKERLLTETAQALSRTLQEIPDAVRSLVHKAASLDKELGAVKEHLLAIEIERMIAETENAGGPRYFVRHLPGRSPEELRFAAKRVSEASAVPVVLFALEPRFQTIVACPGGVPDARAIVARISETLGGRGGGTPLLAQIGLKETPPKPEGEIAAVLEAAVLGGLSVS